MKYKIEIDDALVPAGNVPVSRFPFQEIGQ